MGVSFQWHRVNNDLNAQESFHFSDKPGAATHAEWNPSACWAETFQEASDIYLKILCATKIYKLCL